MNRFLTATAALALLVAPLGGAFAQDWNHGRDDHRGNTSMTMQRHDDNRGNDSMQRHDDNRGNAMMMRGASHHDWRRGERFDRSDWGRYDRVDYRRYHLRTPPRGYEWRRVDNNYVLAAAATGLIASVIAASR